MPRLSWSPSWAPHVVGYYAERTEDMEATDPQVVDLECTVCGATWRTFCYSGKVDRRIGRFSILHLGCRNDG